MEYDDQTLRRLQLEELEILKVVDAFCREQGIQYFLEAGTALGAMRHGGFIPWDDDVDIGMLRSDYERFLKLASTGLPHGFSLHTNRNTPGFAGMFAKVYRDGTAFDTHDTIDAGCPQGIFIDVFPYDFVHRDVDLRKKQVKRAYRWQRISYLYHAWHLPVNGSGLKKRILDAGCAAAHAVVRLCFTPQAIAESFERFARSAENEAQVDGPGSGHSETVADVVCDTNISAVSVAAPGASDNAAVDASRAKDDRMLQLLVYPLPHDVPYDVIFPPVERCFEGVCLFCPAQTTRYLEAMYGETWTELPPKDKRKSHCPVNIRFSDE